MEGAFCATLLFAITVTIINDVYFQLDVAAPDELHVLRIAGWATCATAFVVGATAFFVPKLQTACHGFLLSGSLAGITLLQTCVQNGDILVSAVKHCVIGALAITAVTAALHIAWTIRTRTLTSRNATNASLFANKHENSALIAPLH